MNEITLDDIKRFYEGTSTIYIRWLIEQAKTLEKCAERNEELEEENKALHNGMKMLDSICNEKGERLRLSEFRENRTRERKKRYREALKFYADENNYGKRDCGIIVQPAIQDGDKGNTARKALEGGRDE